MTPLKQEMTQSKNDVILILTKVYYSWRLVKQCYSTGGCFKYLFANKHIYYIHDTNKGYNSKS